MKRRRQPVWSAVKFVAFAAVVYFFVLPLVPGFRKAGTELSRVRPLLLILGIGLEAAALFAYSLLTRAALGASRTELSSWRMFRIQMSTKAVGGVVPGGGAASSTLGYHLLTLSGVPGTDAGFALGTAGLGSAVVLNVIFWLALIVSIPLHGMNKAYTGAAIAGVLLMCFAAAIVFGLKEGECRSERALRWVARHLRQDEDRVGDAVRRIAHRVVELFADRRLLVRVTVWAAANWLLDAAALWVFLRAFGHPIGVDGLLVAFGLANIVAVVPITPGGLGIVEGVYVPTLIGFGLSRATATLGVASYRLAQFVFPVVLGGLLYVSLRVGPGRIERRERVKQLRDIAVHHAHERRRQGVRARSSERVA